MPDPIRVDFRRRRARKPASSPAPTPATAHRGRPPERAVNWRAVPRFLLIVIPILAVMALLRWLVH